MMLLNGLIPHKKRFHSRNEFHVDSLLSETSDMGYLVDSSSHYILGVGVPALVASTIVL